MKKVEFISKLQEKLGGLPSYEVREHLTFYGEIIDDRIEEGFSEEDAVATVGSVDKIASQIVSEIPLIKKANEGLSQKRRLGAWEIVLIILGSPLWISLAAAVFAVIISLYTVLWSVIVSFWAIFLSVAVSAPAGIAIGLVSIFCGGTVQGLTLISGGLVLAGLAIFAFFGCLYAARGSAMLTKASFVGIKKLFIN